MAADHDVSIDLHMWKKPANDTMVALFTISQGHTAICFDLPLPSALEAIRTHLETL